MTNLNKYTYVCLLCLLSLATFAQKKSISQEEAKAKILSLQKTYEEAVAAKDLSTIMTLYEEGAVYLPFQHIILEGKSQIQKAWQRTFNIDLAKFDLELISVEVSGDFLFEVGRTHSIFQMPGGQAPGEFKYLNVWRRQPDGEFKIFRAAYNQWVDRKSTNN